MRAAASALRISFQYADFAWTSRERLPLVSRSRNALRFYPTRKLLSDCAHICGGSVSRSSLVTAAMRPSCGRVNAGEAPIDLSTEGGLLESGAIFGRHF